MFDEELTDTRKREDFGSPLKTFLYCSLAIVLGMGLALLGEATQVNLGDSMIVSAFRGRGNTYWSYPALSEEGQSCNLVPRVMAGGIISVIEITKEQVTLKYTGKPTAWNKSCGVNAVITTQPINAAKIFAYWQR